MAGSWLYGIAIALGQGTHTHARKQTHPNGCKLRIRKACSQAQANVTKAGKDRAVASTTVAARVSAFASPQGPPGWRAAAEAGCSR